MAESMIVWLIVAAVAVLVGRSLYRTITGRQSGCSCGTASCPSAARCQPAAVPEPPPGETCADNAPPPAARL